MVSRLAVLVYSELCLRMVIGGVGHWLNIWTMHHSICNSVLYIFAHYVPSMYNYVVIMILIPMCFTRVYSQCVEYTFLFGILIQDT